MIKPGPQVHKVEQSCLTLDQTNPPSSPSPFLPPPSPPPPPFPPLLLPSPLPLLSVMLSRWRDRPSWHAMFQESDGRCSDRGSDQWRRSRSGRW